MNLRLVLNFILLCCLAVLLAFSCWQFYSQPSPPAFLPFHLVYHFLHGESPHPSQDRPFPRGEFLYDDIAAKLDLGNLGSLLHGTVHARVTSLLLDDSVTRVGFTFHALTRDSLPSISTLAPRPTMHVGQSIFPARAIRTTDRPGKEMSYTFDFASVGSIEDYALRVFLEEGHDQNFRLDNPTPRVPFTEQTGTNLWGTLIVISFILAISLLVAADSGPGPLVDTLLGHWRVMDSARQKAAEKLGVEDEPSTFEERYRAAQRSLSRAEGIIMDFYNDNLKSGLRAAWVCVALLFAFLVLGALFMLAQTWAVPRVLSNLGGAGSNTTAERLQLLEQGRRSTIVYLALAGAVGFTAIGANLILSTWHTKAKARKLMRRRLDEFHDSFQEEIVNKLAQAEHALQQMNARGRSVSERLEATHARVAARQRSHDQPSPQAGPR
jgi:hypothetical protein